MSIQSVSVLGYSALPVGSYMPGPAADGAVFEHERLLEVVDTALHQAGIEATEVGALIFTGTAPPTVQKGFPPFFAARAGMKPDAQLLEVSTMGTTGGSAFDLAVNEVALGHTDAALALGVHFETQATTREAAAHGSRAVGDVDFQSIYGITPIAWYALDAARYLHEYPDVTRTHLAEIAVKSRDFARLNSLAQLREPLSTDQVLQAPMIVEPLGVHDVPPRSDGVICLVVGRSDLVDKADRIDVVGRGFAHDGHHQMGRHPHSMTALPAAAQAVQRALNGTEKGGTEQAGTALAITDMDVLELYAPCTITEAMVSEALGLFSPGTGALAAAEGRTALGADRPLNTSGGCLSRGHPSNVTGLYSILEVVEQLKHAAGERQITNAVTGLALCELGNYNAALAHIFRRGDA